MVFFTYYCLMYWPEGGRNVVVYYMCMTDTLVLLGFLFIRNLPLALLVPNCLRNRF
jgi:hypothetical protein